MLGRPIFLTGHYIDIPMSIEDVARVAALAPPEPRPSRPSRVGRQKRGSVVERARQYLASVDASISGQNGHDAAYRAACILVVDFDLQLDEAKELLLEFNQRCEPPWSDAELDHKLESADKSTGERGRLAEASSAFPLREISPLNLNVFEPFEPEQPPFDVNTIILPSADDGPIVDEVDPLAGFGFGELSTVDTTEISVEQPAPLSTVPMDWLNARVHEGRTDVANGKRLARIISGQARYVRAWDAWIVWDGRRWRQDDLAIREYAKQIPSTIIADAMSIVPVDMNACNWAISSASKPRVDAAISMAKSEPGVPIDHQELDSDPWLLNCINGIVDLRTGELLPHDQSRLITKLCPTKYDPDADSYHWDRFLESVLQSEALIACVQRLFGYCSTGSTREQVLPIFWGSGSNGKTTLVETIMKVLGDEYSSQAPKSLLIVAKNGNDHPTELAMLHGKRFALGSESEDGQRLNEALVKQLTGSDKIVARRMREDFWTFEPTHKLALMTNHKPRIKGTDHGIWRRLVMIPFTQKFWNPAKGESGPPELQRDETLGARLAANLPGVLSWIVRGAMKWYSDGLGLSPEVLAATRDYQTSQDVLGRFVEECCDTSCQASKTRFSRLYRLLETWCDESGDNLPSRRAVGEWLSAHDFARQPSNGETWYSGIDVRPEFDQKTTFEAF